MIFWFVGEATYAYLQIIECKNISNPGPYDIFFFIGYIFLIYYLYKNFKFGQVIKQFRNLM